VLSFGLLLATLLATTHLGWTNIFDTVQQEMGTRGFDPTAKGGFGWEYVIWMGFLGLVGCGIWPTSVARALAMESPQAVKRQYMFASISYLIRFLIPYFWGICAFVFIMQRAELVELFFPAGCPPPEKLPEGVEAVNNLYAMPFFLGQILPAGIIGLITAGMVAAFMSTHDSYLLCWSSVLTQDVIAPVCKLLDRPLGSKTRLTLTRVLIVTIGLYVLYWGLIYQGRNDIWDYLAVTGAIYFSGAFALLLGGLYWRRASSTGAFLALLAGLTAVIGLSPIQDAIGKLLTMFSGWTALLGSSLVQGPIVVKIPSERVGLCSIAATVVAMILGSLLFPDRKPAKEDAATNQGDL